MYRPAEERVMVAAIEQDRLFGHTERFNLIELGILHREVVSVQSLLASTEQLSHYGGNLREAEISRWHGGGV